MARSRNQRPSAILESNQSIARPSFVQTCFRFPVDIAFAGFFSDQIPQVANFGLADAMDAVFPLKPMLKVGSAPIGIYTNFPNVSGLQSYSDVYQDSRLWLREGKQDYLVPQTYWPFGARAGSPDFGEIAKEWAGHTYGREVYPGIGAYKPEVFDQIPRLIDMSRSLGVKPGQGKPGVTEEEIKLLVTEQGTLLDEEWCAFLKREGFMVGISLDGSRDVHDRYRRDKGGNGTFDKALRHGISASDWNM